jgi:hypothetical protein
MRPTRITVLGSFAVATVACGITAVGTQASIDLPDGGESPSSSLDSSSSSSSSASSTSSSSSGGAEDSGIDPADGAGDTILDVGPDVAPLVPPYLVLTHTPAGATTVNLTTEGTKEWAYWGFNGSTTSIRNLGTMNAISAIYRPGDLSSSAATGFGATLSWSNGPNGNTNGSADWYYRIFPTFTTDFEYVRVASGPVKQTLVVVVGGANMRGRMTARFVSGAIASQTDNTYENLTGTFVAKYVLDFASVGADEVELRWTPDVLGASTVELRFTAAALR